MSSLPIKLDTRDFFRFFVSGLISFVSFNPYMEFFFPHWYSYDSTEKIAFALFFALTSGVIFEMIIDLYGRTIVYRIHDIWLYEKIFRRNETKQQRRMYDSFNCQGGVCPDSILKKMGDGQREMLWYNTACCHMYAGIAIVFSISFLLFLSNNIFAIYSFVLNYGLNFSSGMIMPIIMNIGIFLSFVFVIILSLKLSVSYSFRRFTFLDSFGAYPLI